MNQRIHVLFTAIAAGVLGQWVGRVWFVPLLTTLFPAFQKRIGPAPADEIAAAAAGFGWAACALLAMVPLSALVTERFASTARYLPALAKSLLVGLLAFGIMWFYQTERWASLGRLNAKMPGLFGPEGPALPALRDNTLTTLTWITAICLVVFGPVDLWIARLQKQRRADAAAAKGSSGAEPEKTAAPLPEK
jgi:hypothetical protein